MTTRTKIRSLTAAAMLAAPLSAFAQTNFVETEPNNAKTVANSFTMASGDTITGTSTGTSSVTTSTLATTADYYRIKTTPAALGIYRNRLIMNTANTGTMTFSLRGLSQSSGVINTASDASVATADTARAGVTPSTARSLQYYSFGREEEVFVSVVGATATTQPYTITLERTPVTPVSLGTTIIEGQITLTNTPTNTADTAITVYDSNFNIINAADNNLRGINDDRPITIGTGLAAGLRRTFAPGTYYVAWTGSNQATNLANPTDDSFRGGNRLDFPNAVAGTRNLSTADANIRISGANFTTFDTTGLTFPGNDRGFMHWFEMVVNPNLVPTPPAVASASTDRPGAAGDTVTINVTITPGTNPTSSTLLVEGDLSAITGTPGLTTFTQNTFTTYSATVVVGSGGAVTPGRKLLPITVTDDLSRTGTGNASAIVATDLGFLVGSATGTIVPTPGEVAWFKFTTLSDSGSCLAFDFNTLNNPPTGVDTVLAIYNAAGTQVALSDDFGGRLESLLSFGFASPARAYPPFTTSAAGQNGLTALPPGVYFAAVLNYASGYSLPLSGFNATTPSASLNPLTLNARMTLGALSPIVATGSSTVAFEGESDSRDATVTITPGSCPTSSGLIVTATGPSGESLSFSNTSGNTWTATIAGNPSLTAGTYPITVNIVDDQARTASATINYNVRALTNLGVIHGGSAQPVSGTSAFTAAPREGWFKFKTLAPTSASNFVDVTTLGSVYAGGPLGVNDSIAALYSSTGALLAQGDDNYAGSSSTAFSFGQAAPVRNYAPHTANFIGAQGTLPAGTYYLGVAPYNATNSRLANFVFSTAAAGTGTNAANIYNNLPCVNPADIADTDGNPSPDGVVDNGDFTAFFAAFFLDESDPARLVADLGNTDGLTVLDIGGGPDTTVDNGDFTAFFTYFFNGLCQP